MTKRFATFTDVPDESVRDKLLQEPLTSVPQAKDSNKKINKEINKEINKKMTEGHSDIWLMKTIRMKQSTITALDRIAGIRKTKRKEPFKLQEIITEAVESWLAQNEQ